MTSFPIGAIAIWIGLSLVIGLLSAVMQGHGKPPLWTIVVLFFFLASTGAAITVGVTLFVMTIPRFSPDNLLHEIGFSLVGVAFAWANTRTLIWSQNWIHDLLGVPRSPMISFDTGPRRRGRRRPRSDRAARKAAAAFARERSAE